MSDETSVYNPTDISALLNSEDYSTLAMKMRMYFNLHLGRK